jgi:hypothetical protein
MGTYGVPTRDSGDVVARRDAARDGRAAAMSRRRALAAGRSALAPAHERVRTGFREADLRAAAPAVDGKPLTASSGGTAVAINGVAEGHLGRALSKQRRRQLSQGKRALNGGGDQVAVAGAGAPTFTVHRGGAG